MDLSFLTGVTNLQSTNEIALNESREDNNAALLKLLSGLSNGETLLSNVIDVKDGMVELKLADGIYINAKQDKNINLTPGSNVFLEVEKHSDSSVSLRPLYQNNNQEKTAEVALKAANLPINGKTLELVARRMEYFEPIDRNALINSYKDVNDNPAFPVKYIVDLQNMGIERTPENLTQYGSYLNMENSVTEALSNIEGAVLSELSNEISEALISDSTELPLTDSLIAFSDKLSGNGMETMDSDLISNLKEDLPGLNFKNLEALTEMPSSENASETENVPVKLSSKEVFKAFLTDIKENLSLNEETNPEIAKSIGDPTKKDSVIKLINRVFSDEFTVDAEKMSEKKEIKDLYQRIYSGSENLLNALRESGIQNESIRTPVNNLSNNLDFMNALNNFVPYVQIPFNGENGRENGELYVFKNKKSLTDGSGALSAFIHLDMDNLGPTDVFVSLAGEKVTTDFRVADDECLTLIEKNIGLLNKRLNDKGYSFEMEIKLSEENKAPIETILDEKKGNVLLSNITFDARV